MKGFSELFGVQYKVEHNNTSEGDEGEEQQTPPEGFLFIKKKNQLNKQLFITLIFLIYTEELFEQNFVF